MQTTVRAKLTWYLKFALFCGILYASYLLIQLSLPYIGFEPSIEFLRTKELIYHLDWWRISFYIHVFSSPIVILSGLFQFSRTILRKHKIVHRRLGMIYLIFVVFISGPSGFLIGLYANGGYPVQISFAILSSLWILFTLLAYLKIRKKEYALHSQWMLRSYALTLSAVTLRLYAFLFDVFNLPFGPTETYIIVSYLSWIPNLLFAEICIRKGWFVDK